MKSEQIERSETRLEQSEKVSGETEKQCYICYSDDKDLVSPCDCSGSVGHICRDCVRSCIMKMGSVKCRQCRSVYHSKHPVPRPTSDFWTCLVIETAFMFLIPLSGLLLLIPIVGWSILALLWPIAFWFYFPVLKHWRILRVFYRAMASGKGDDLLTGLESIFSSSTSDLRVPPGVLDDMTAILVLRSQDEPRTTELELNEGSSESDDEEDTPEGFSNSLAGSLNWVYETDWLYSIFVVILIYIATLWSYRTHFPPASMERFISGIQDKPKRPKGRRSK